MVRDLAGHFAADLFSQTGDLTEIAAQGRMSAEEPAAFYAKVGGLIGIDPGLVARNRGRVSEVVFASNLMNSTRQVIDTYDGTQVSDNPRPEKGELGFSTAR